MRVKCSFPECRQYYKIGCGVQFFRFPIKNAEICREWMKTVGKGETNISKYWVVCSLHFTPGDYLQRPGTYVKRLKPDAVPSIPVPGAARILPHITKEQDFQTRFTSTMPINIEIDTNDIPVETDIESELFTEMQYAMVPLENLEETDNSREKDQEIQANISASDTPRKQKLKRTIKTLRQQVARQKKKIDCMKTLLKVLDK